MKELMASEEQSKFPELSEKLSPGAGLPAPRRRGGSSEQAGCEQGTFLLELALVTIPIVIVLAGTIDFSLAFKEHAVMLEAAKAGSWTAARLEGATSDVMRDVALGVTRRFLNAAGYDATSFRFNVRHSSVACLNSGADVLEMTVSRNRANRFFIMPSNGFKSCVGAAFRIVSSVKPTVSIGDSTCALRTVNIPSASCP